MITETKLSLLINLFLSKKILSLDEVQTKLKVSKRHIYRLMHSLREKGYLIGEKKKEKGIKLFVLREQNFTINKLIISQRELLALNNLSNGNTKVSDLASLAIDRINKKAESGH